MLSEKEKLNLFYLKIATIISRFSVTVQSTRPAVWTRRAEPTAATTVPASVNLHPVQQRRHHRRLHPQHRRQPNSRSTSSTEKKRFQSATSSSVTPTKET